jgi:hypothetical protein
MGNILRFLFPATEGYDVIQEVEGDANTRPDFGVFKVSRRPGGTLWQYDFMLTESKKQGEAWGSSEDHLHSHLAGTDNESKHVYGMLQIGLEVQFYKYARGAFTKVGGKMHLVTHVSDMVTWSRWLKANPLPFV